MRRLATTSAVAALVLAGCGDTDTADDPDPTTTSTTPAPPGSTSTTSPSAATSSTVDPPASSSPATPVEVATINVLHGIPGLSGCAEATDFCHAPTRIAVLWDLLARQAGCPEIVALQEISPRQQELVPGLLDDLCAGDHQLLVDDVGSPDQEMILTTLTVVDDRRIELAGAPFWSAHWARLESDDGRPIEVFSTHYASSSLNPPCSTSTTCSPECPPETLFGDCHPIETLAVLGAEADPDALQLVVGDLNQPIDHPRLRSLTEAGFVDTHLAAGNAECDPSTGSACTAGIGGDTDLDGLDLADQTPRSRIDYVLVRPPAGCDLLVDATDADGDGTRTGLWADEPLPEPADGLFWASDHTGVQADVGVHCG